MNFTEKKRKVLREIDTKELRTENGIPYEVFINTPKAIRVTEDCIGKKIWYIGDTRTTNISLKEFNEDHVLLKYGDGSLRAVFKNEVLLHPDEWNKNLLKDVQ